jgi:OmpA-OmpF porin, OOP family
MNKNKSIIKLLLSVALFIPLFGFSQSSSHINTVADKFYKEGDFYNAAKLYEQIETGDSIKDAAKPYMPAELPRAVIDRKKNNEIIFRIGYSYYQLHDYKKAQPWFEKIKDNNIACFYFACCLRANMEYDEAENNFHSFLSTDSANDFYTVQAHNELNDLAFITEQLNNKTDSFIVHKIDDNNATSDYAITFEDSNDIILTSTRLDSSLLQSNQNPYLNQLYSATINGQVVNISGKPGIAMEKDMHQGIASFTPDGNKLFFTRWFKNNNDTIAGIYVTEKKNNVWLTPVKLNSNVNVEGYKSIQPFITADGKYLIYSSNRPGGIGKYDLWYAPLDNNYQPGIATNLGPVINTIGNDEAPFYHSASNTLIFSSDARTGMGGFDLYQSKGNFIQWDTVTNLGYPVNSSKDDIYFYCSNSGELWSNAYLSSDRSSECCLQLFSIEYIKPAPAVVSIDTINIADTVIQTSTDTELVVTENENNSSPIYFEFNSASLADSFHTQLDSLSALLHADPQLVLELSGYTDNLGSVKYNLKLSAQRVMSCVKYLLKHGVNKKQLIIHWYGKCCPVAAEKLSSGKDDPSGRQKNRRVELKRQHGQSQ